MAGQEEIRKEQAETGDEPDRVLSPQDEVRTVKREAEAGPDIDVDIGDKKFNLTAQNTLVRKFGVGEGVYDYAQHRGDEGDGFYVFLQSEAGDKLKPLLEEYGFPVEYSDLLDEDALLLYKQQYSKKSDK